MPCPLPRLLWGGASLPYDIPPPPLPTPQDEVGLIASAIWSKFLDPNFGCVRMNHRYRLRTIPDSYTAADIVSWLMSNGHVTSR